MHSSCALSRQTVFKEEQICLLFSPFSTGTSVPWGSGPADCQEHVSPGRADAEPNMHLAAGRGGVQCCSQVGPMAGIVRLCPGQASSHLSYLCWLCPPSPDDMQPLCLSLSLALPHVHSVWLERSRTCALFILNLSHENVNMWR